MKKKFDLYHVSRTPGNEVIWEYRFAGYSNSNENLLCRFVVYKTNKASPFSGHYVIYKTDSDLNLFNNIRGVADIPEEAEDKAKRLMKKEINSLFSGERRRIKEKYLLDRTREIDKRTDIDSKTKKRLRKEVLEELVSLSCPKIKEVLIDECGLYKVREPRKLKVTASHPKPEKEPIHISDSRH